MRPLAEALAAAEQADIVCLATPAEASAELAPKILALGKRVVDLSGAFRLPDPAQFRAVYGFEHPAPALAREAHYGLRQLPGAAGGKPIEEARLVANPGCYATSAILPLAALLESGLIEDSPIFIDGKSGITGAGRKLAEKFLFTEVAENLSAYRVLSHQHEPEMELALSRLANRPIEVHFVPHLIPIRRGILTTIYGRTKAGVTQEALTEALRAFYADHASPFEGPVVRTMSADEVQTQAVWGTPACHMGVRVDTTRGRFAAVSAIDNLMKGAASQALENVLAMLSA